MKSKIENLDDIWVVRLTGRFDGTGAVDFEQETAGIPVDNVSGWIMDMDGVAYLSSSGIRAMIAAGKKLRASGGRLYLCNIRGSGAEILKIAGLLREFKVFDSLENAISGIRAVVSAPKFLNSRAGDHGTYDIRHYPESTSFIETWGFAGSGAMPASVPETLTPVLTEELGYGFGFGGFGDQVPQAAGGAGLFMVLGGFAGVLPANGWCRPDFFIIRPRDEDVVYVSAAIGIAGRPCYRFTTVADQPVLPADFFRDIFEACQSLRKEAVPLIGFVLLADRAEGSVSFYKTPEALARGERVIRTMKNPRPMIAVGLAVNGATDDAGAGDITAVFSFLPPSTARTGPLVYAHAVMLSRTPGAGNVSDPADLSEMLSFPHDFQELFSIEPGIMLTNARAWIYIPAVVRPGLQKRVRFNIPDDLKWPSEWDILARQIFCDSAKVELNPLYGGFTATVFRAERYDEAGRRQAPTVLKIGHRDNIEREEKAYRLWVEKYIHNNAARILKTARHAGLTAICYNFVGVSGSDSRLQWLREHYVRRPIHELMVLFDRIFTEVLKPWYGQPRMGFIRPYEEHLPSPDLFPNLMEDAGRYLNVSADDPDIDCPVLGIRLPNPYYALKHVFPKRRNLSMPGYTGITHGDLNMQNILIDERENIYIIDFSETRVRNIVSDFARLEPIFLFETTRLKTENDVHRLLPFIRDLYSTKDVGEIPPNRYAGDDPMVGKAHALIGRLRTYADTVTLFEADPIPHRFAVLQWTLPAVSYGGFSTLQKRLALYTSAIICANIGM